MRLISNHNFTPAIVGTQYPPPSSRRRMPSFATGALSDRVSELVITISQPGLPRPPVFMKDSPDGRCSIVLHELKITPCTSRPWTLEYAPRVPASSGTAVYVEQSENRIDCLWPHGYLQPEAVLSVDQPNFWGNGPALRHGTTINSLAESSTWRHSVYSPDWKNGAATRLETCVDLSCSQRNRACDHTCRNTMILCTPEDPTVPESIRLACECSAITSLVFWSLPK